MSTDRSARLTPSQLAFKLACREAVKAAGGQEFVGQECGRAQSRISDWCSPNTADFMPVDVVATIEALGAGSPGHPHVSRALARAAGGSFTPVAGGLNIDAPRLGQWLGEVAGECSDVIGALAAGQLDAGLTALAPRQRAEILREVCELNTVTARFERALRTSGPDTS